MRHVVVFNAGSSSLKFGLFTDEGGLLGKQVCEGEIDWSGAGRGASGVPLVVQRAGGGETRLTVDGADHGAAVRAALTALTEGASPLLASLGEIAAIGHRVVHGGETYRESVRVDGAVKQEIAALADLAPLHNPANLDGINAAEAVLPGVPQVAVFDTAFHAHLPPESYLYAVPYAWYTQWGVRRYGFHGISHAYCAARAAELLGRPLAGLRLITLHLGNGCSAAAIRDGVSVETTMGFTPLEGLMMGTRSGSVDPGLLLYLERHRSMTTEGLDDALNHQSGLLGLSGVSSDMRGVLAAADGGHERAQLALRGYTYRVRTAIGALAASLGGLDTLVFTAGVGENAAAVRAAACAGLEFLGVRLDEAANATAKPDVDISAAGAPVRVLVVHTQEDLYIARETLRLIESG
jgi:acetate kinase